MATKSILKTVVIRDEKAVRAFVRALEQSKNATPKPVELSKPCSVATVEEIKKMFAEF